ncbi:hypothetical protein HNQ94_003460 [Salirhabdus euzebyi]|uniref:Uncharacterized protein n=1 Tax=Salirhabdus euzebyi TaxID=394506 RepID=A0A841Q996_9BACI|nr:hypothetical protein [Salirhabdus euzebyi]
MTKWIFVQYMLILWSFYILIIHISSKDHPLAIVLCFVWFFLMAFYLGRKFIRHHGVRCLYIIGSFFAIYTGHQIFQVLIN